MFLTCIPGFYRVGGAGSLSPHALTSRHVDFFPEATRRRRTVSQGYASS